MTLETARGSGMRWDLMTRDWARKRRGRRGTARAAGYFRLPGIAVGNWFEVTYYSCGPERGGLILHAGSSCGGVLSIFVFDSLVQDLVYGLLYSLVKG